MIVPGRQSWVTDRIELAGGEDPGGAEPVKSLPIEVSDAVKRDPDAVVISWCGVALEKYRTSQVLERAGWEETTAVRHQQVYPVAEAFLGRPGPRLVEDYRHLCDVIDGVATRSKETEME